MIQHRIYLTVEHELVETMNPERPGMRVIYRTPPMKFGMYAIMSGLSDRQYKENFANAISQMTEKIKEKFSRMSVQDFFEYCGVTLEIREKAKKAPWE